MKHFLSALLALTLFISCSKSKKTENADVAVDNVAKNEQQIKDYVAKNKLDAHRTESGLYYVINDPGTGAQPTPTSNVTVAYKGSFIDGKVFDESSAGISFGLDQVIKGWTEGIPYFKTGGSGTLIVPAHLGYGDNDYSSIPGGSVLIFDIKLISIN